MISTHVLDCAQGIPAAGLNVRLFRLRDGEQILLATAQTDANGRISPIFGGELEPATYLLLFSAGDYFERMKTATFFDEIPVRFAIDDGAAHYHVPLLLSPFAYSTYRGS